MEACSARLQVRRCLVGLFGVACALAVLAPAKLSEAAPITVTSLGDFNTAIGTTPTTSDPFDNAIAGGLSITFDSGVDSTLSGGVLTDAAQDNLVTGGQFFGEVDGNGDEAALVLTWTFPSPVVGACTCRRNRGSTLATLDRRRYLCEWPVCLNFLEKSCLKICG